MRFWSGVFSLMEPVNNFMAFWGSSLSRLGEWVHLCLTVGLIIHLCLFPLSWVSHGLVKQLNVASLWDSFGSSTCLWLSVFFFCRQPSHRNPQNTKLCGGQENSLNLFCSLLFWLVTVTSLCRNRGAKNNLKWMLIY